MPAKLTEREALRAIEKVCDEDTQRPLGRVSFRGEICGILSRVQPLQESPGESVEECAQTCEAVMHGDIDMPEPEAIRAHIAARGKEGEER